MTAERESRYCGARKRQGEGTCTRPAGWGTNHPGVGLCKLHGGSMPVHQAAARRVISQQVATRAVEEWGLEVETTPQEAVLRQLGRLHMRVRAIEHLVSTTARGDGRVVDAHDLAVTEEWGPPAPLVRETLPRQWGTEIRVVRNPLLDVLRDAERDLLGAAKVVHDMGVAEALVAATIADADRYLSFAQGLARRLGLEFDERWIEAGAESLAELEAGS